MAEVHAEAFKRDGVMQYQMGGRTAQGWGVDYDSAAAYFQQPTNNWPTQTRPGGDVQVVADLLCRSLQQAQAREEFCGSYFSADPCGGATLGMPSPTSPKVPLQAAGAQEPFTSPSSGPPLPWKLMGCASAPPGLGLPRELNPKSSRIFDDGVSNRSTDEGLSASNESAEEDMGTGRDKDSFLNSRDDGSMPPCGDDVHALMIKHLPCRCTKEEVLNAIAEVGYGDYHNFFYLPLRRGHTQNFGYAFVGFGTKELAASFSEAMTGYRFKGRSSAKACEIATARIQGVNSNADRLQKTRCSRKRAQQKPM